MFLPCNKNKTKNGKVSFTSSICVCFFFTFAIDDVGIEEKEKKEL